MRLRQAKDLSAHHFFAAFWRTGRQSTRTFRFIRTLYREQPEWFHTWCENKRILLEGEWRPFILDALYFLSPACLKRINSEEWLTKNQSPFAPSDPILYPVDLDGTHMPEVRDPQ